MSIDPPYWQDSEDHDATYDCDLGVIRLVIRVGHVPYEGDDPGHTVLWECHWLNNYESRTSSSVEQAKLDAQVWARELLRQQTAQLERLEP